MSSSDEESADDYNGNVEQDGVNYEQVGEQVGGNYVQGSDSEQDGVNYQQVGVKKTGIDLKIHYINIMILSLLR